MTNFVTLTQVRTQLRFPTPSSPSSDDSILQILMDAADEVLEFECDDVLPHRYDEMYDGGNLSIFLRHRPLLSVQNVEEGWGWLNYELDYQEVNSPAPAFSLYAYSIDSYENAEISRRSAGNVQIPFRPGQGNIRVQYTTGMQKIPASLQLAELELIAHWYQNSMLRAMTVAGANLGYDAVEGSLYSRDTESGNQNLNIGVPYRILEQIKRWRHMPFIA